jgi:hypothetical protein
VTPERECLSAGPEQPIARISESGKDIPNGIELAIESRSDDRDIGVGFTQATYSLGRGHETEELDTRGTCVLESCDCGNGAPPGRQHGVEHEKLAFSCIGWNLEVVINRLKRIVVAVQADVTDTRRRYEAQNSLDHTQSRSEDRHEDELLTRHATANGFFERCLHRVVFKGQAACGFIGHEHRDLIDQLFEDLRRRVPVAQDRELMLHQGMANNEQAGNFGGGGHDRESSIFARMKEYQAVIVRLTRRVREDEDAVTDLLNERSRGGWELELITQDPERVTVVFARRAEPGR